jgi:hypothetical protein
MKRKHFLLISGLVAWIFSVGMMLMPSGFTSGISTVPPTPEVNAWAQFLGTNLFAIGFINIFASRSPWSGAVRAILWGNIILHLLAVAADANAYMNNIINLQGIMQSTIVHLVFIIGFFYYTFVKSTHDMNPAKQTADSKLPDAA